MTTIPDYNLQDAQSAAMMPARVIFDMTFPNRFPEWGFSVYARSLLNELQRRDDVVPHVIAGPAIRGPLLTLAWLLGGARRSMYRATGARVGRSLLHCPAFVTPWRSPLRYIISMHDAASLRFPHDYPLEWRVYNRFILPRLASRAAMVITATEVARNDLTRFYGLDREKIVVTPYGIDNRYRQPVDTQALADKRRQLSPSSPLLLFSGAPFARKNLDIVLRVMADAPEESSLSQARLAISGATETGFYDYRAWIAAHGLQERVLWLGRVTSTEMPSLYAAADILVYPSFYEGFGLPPLEAMAVGTPVVASDASCLPEVLGDAALLVDPRDDRAFASAVEAVLSRSDVRARLIAAGKERSALYTWAGCAEQTASIYREVLAAQR